MNFKLILKNLIILVLIVLIFLNIYFGIFLTYKKSVNLIYGLRLLQFNKIQTVNDFKEVFSNVLNLDSYVGQEEAVKITGQYILNIINNKNIEKEASKALLEFIEPYFLEKEYFHNIVKAQLYHIYYLKSNEELFLNKTEEIYLKMIKENPNFPLFYISLFNFYLETNQLEKAKQIREEILNNWPSFKEAEVKLNNLE